MRTILARLCPRLVPAVLGLCLLTIEAVAGTPPSPPPTTLQSLAAWDAHGLGGGVLTGVVTGTNAFSGTLRLDNVPAELSPQVIGFKAVNQRLYSLALIYPGKSLVGLLPALRDTALADLAVPQVVVCLTPPANAGASVQVPGVVGAVRMPLAGGATIKLEAGATVMARGDLGGHTAELLRAVGAPVRDVTLSGKLDPRMLSGAGLKSALLQNELMDGLELRVALRAPALDRKPAYLAFGESALVLKGENGTLAAHVATSVTVQAGSGVRFEHVRISRDPVKRVVTIQGRTANPGASFLSLPVAGAAITEVAFRGSIDEQTPANDAFKLDGKYVAGGSTPRGFTAVLSGASPAQYVVTVETDTSLAQLMGWHAPGLDALVLKDVVFGNGYVLGNLALKGMRFTVVLFKATGQTKPSAAFLSGETFRLPKLMSGLLRTPLADLDLVHPAFVLVPEESAGRGITLPDPVARHVGVPTLDLTHGLNLVAHANLDGNVAALLTRAGLSAANVLLTGSLDAGLLAAAEGTRTDAIVQATTLRAALAAAAPRGGPRYLAFGPSLLTLTGEKAATGAQIATAVATSVTVHLVGTDLRFEHVALTHDPGTGVLTLAGTGPSHTDFLKLPVAGAAITDLALAGRLDERTPANDRFSLDGHYTVGGSTPRAYSATLSGGPPAQYVVTIQTDTTLNALLGWHVPGLDALVLTDVVFATDYILGDLSLKGMTFKVALFKGAGQTKYNAAFLSLETFSLPKLVAAMHDTPLADLDLVRPAFVLAPQENAHKAVKLPPPVAAHVGAPNMDLAYGLNLYAHANAHGPMAALLQAVSLSPSNLLITGTLDAAVLAGADGPLADTVINATSLQAALPVAAPRSKPAYLAFGETVLWMKGVSGKVASGLATSVSVNVGRGVRFDPVTITRDPVTQVVAIAGTSPSSTAFLPLPVAGAAIADLAFTGSLDERTPANDRFSLDGHYKVGGNTPRAFSAALSGGTPAQYVVTVHADITLAELLHWSGPGVDGVVFKEVVFGNDYALGNTSIRGLPFAVAAFKAGGHDKWNAAFLSDGTFSFPKLMSALQPTPLADLEIARPGLVLVPQENAGTGVKLPDPVARHVGAQSVDLKRGLNLIANGNAYGDLAALLDKLGISSKNLPIVGTLDPAILSNVDAAALAQPFLDALDVHAPLPKFSLPGVAHNVTVTTGMLALKGIAKGIDASVLAKLAVTTASGAPLLFDAGLRLVKAASGVTVSLVGAYPGEWKSPFGIDWLNVRDVRIRGSFGEVKEFALSGTTDIGRVRTLTVLLDLLAKIGTDVTLEVTGADVSLADIPKLSSIPNVGDLKFRDLVISASAIGGTLKSATLPFLHDVQAVAFDWGGHWNLAALLAEVDLSKLMKLPPFAQPVLGKLKLGKAVLLLAQADFSSRVALLPLPAQAHLLEIYGVPTAIVQAVRGVNLVSRFDPAAMGPALTTVLPSGQTLVLQGGVGGVIGGGAPTLALCATVPRISLPHSLGFIALPSGARTAFCVRLSQTVASAGVEIQAVIGAKLNQQTVTFDTTIALELDNQGGVAAGLEGKSLNRWQNVMGIKGLSLDPGTRLQVKTAASSELTLAFLGKTHIGSREADVAGSASILAGVVDKGAFEVKLSELTLADLVALFNEAVKAGGGKPVEVDFPDAKLRNVDIAFASPGANVPELGLPNGGTRLAGDLWFLLKDKALAKVKADMSDTRLVMTGDISDFALGPVAFKDNKLDVLAQSAPPVPPVFKIRGGVTILNRHVSGEMDSGLTETALVSSVDLGGLLNLDLHASLGTPPATGLDARALASQDLALNARLKSDVGAWVRGEGKKAAAKVFDSLGGDIKKLIAGVEAAQKEVDRLNGLIAKAKERAHAGAKTVDQQIAQAQKRVDDVAGRVESIKRDISSEKDKIHGCNYSVSICYWWNWRGHCTKHKDVPDVGRDAECEASNARHAATIAGYEAALKSAEAAKAAADAVLTGLKKGEQGVDVASLDPEVIALEASLVTAQLALDAAKLPAQGAELGIQQLEAGLKALDRADVFVLKETAIMGSLQKALAGQAVVLGLEFDAAGKPQHLRLAFSLTKPEYNAKQLETLALLVAKVAVEALPGVGPAVTHLVNDAFKSHHDAADKEVAQAAKANGLE